MLLKVDKLFKKYKPTSDYAVSDISFYGISGEIVGILGHNGAGKSTIIKCVTGMHPYNEGIIEICGNDLIKNPLEAKSSFGYVSDQYMLFETMTGMEYINFMADIYQVSIEDRKKRIEMFQEIFQLGPSINNQISSYSHGMKQKISFMAALIHNPKVFILDEPMVGLDPYTSNQVKLFFKKYSEAGNLVIFSSHNLDVVEKVCDRAYIINQGKMLEEINIEQFKESGKDLEEYFLSITERVAKA